MQNIKHARARTFTFIHTHTHTHTHTHAHTHMHAVVSACPPCAVRRRPVRRMSIAMALPNSSRNRSDDANSGTNASFAKGTHMFAAGHTKTASQLGKRVIPMPTALPFTAATSNYEGVSE